MSALDPRLHAYRSDLADARLAGRVTAERFVAGEPRRVIAPLTELHPRPEYDSPWLTQVLHGEDVLVFEDRDGWAFAQLLGDSYVGYVPSTALGGDLAAPGHRVVALLAPVFARPDLRSPSNRLLPILARVAGGMEGEFLRLTEGGFVPRQHVAPLGETANDFVAVAERLIGTPYRWGGKSALGIDCSGLVQLSMQAAGLTVPRDSDMQESSVGNALDPSEFGKLSRGDLVFWRGHVGIMTDRECLLHANAHHMAVTLEPLVPVINRAELKGSPLTSIRRPPGLRVTIAA